MPLTLEDARAVNAGTAISLGSHGLFTAHPLARQQKHRNVYKRSVEKHRDTSKITSQKSGITLIYRCYSSKWLYFITTCRPEQSLQEQHA